MGNPENADKSVNNINQQQMIKAMFHDFLGTKPSTADAKTVDASPSAAVGGGRAHPLSFTSGLGSERQGGNRLEGIPFYGTRSEVPEITNRLIGGKRSNNSDSTFAGSNRDGVPQMGGESLESLHLMKMLKNVGGGERPRVSNDDGIFYNVQSMRPSSASLTLQPSAGGNRDAVLKWDQSVPTGTAINYASRGSQLVHFVLQGSTDRFKDNNPVASTITPPAADEGSRTGIKGPGILSSINSGSGASEKILSTSMPSTSKPMSGTHFSELESSMPSRPSLTSTSRQMTIFYGGQAHVFDDVHPNKADVIMALAGSNGGSWTTSYSPKPTTTKPCGGSYTTSREPIHTGGGPNAAFQRKYHGRLSGKNNADQGVIACADGRPLSTGGHHDSVLMNKETRSRIQSGEAIAEDKRE